MKVFRHHETGFSQTAIEAGTPPRSEAAPLLKRLAVAFEALGSQWRRGLAINAHERLALNHLWESGPMTMSELGERIPLSRAAITALTDRLERMGYVVRTPDVVDRRRTLLSITARPYQMYAPLMRPMVEDVAAVVNELSDDEWETVSRFVLRMHDVSSKQAARLRQLSDDELSALVDEAHFVAHQE
jgi:DNA-binding MarR family transcriptional regulator